MASNNLIASYKGYILAPIYKQYKLDGGKKTKKQLEKKMKAYTKIVKGCDEMTDEEIGYHAEGCKAYSALRLNQKIDFENDSRIDLDFNRTNKNN